MEKESNKEEDYNFTLRKTRKAFLIEYLCGSFLLILILTFALKGVKLQFPAKILIGSIAFVSLVTAEVSRIFTKYKVTKTKLIIIHGLIKQKKKNVYFHPLGFVTDINTKQTRLQRLLNYGTIYVNGGGGNTFEIKDINNPKKVMDIVEKLIAKNR